MTTGNPRRYCSARAGLLLVVLIVSAAYAAPAFAQGPQAAAWTVPERKMKQRNPVAPSEQNIAEGKKLYLRECAPCHGWTGHNDGPNAPREISKSRKHTDPTLLDDTDGALFWKISEGRPPMPSTRGVLSDQERWMIVNYMRTLADKPKSATP